MRRQRNLDTFGRRTLWLTAAVFATIWAPQLHANEVGRTSGTTARPAQAATSAPPEPQAAERQDPHNAEMMARELAATKQDLDTLLKLLNRACGGSAHAGQAADREVAELQKALGEERDRNERLDRDLAVMRGLVEPQGTPAPRTGDDLMPSNASPDAGAADLRESLQQERDRAGRLEQDLAAARRDVETQTALAAKAETEASQLKTTADAGAADLRQSLQQERERASRLEQDLAAARREVKTQTALVAKAGAEAIQLKKTTDATAADLRKSLQQERERASRLEKDLTTARREVKTQTALAAKAGAEASQVRKTADASAADWQKSLQQEHDRASGLEQDLAAARRDVEAQTALAAKASDDADRLRRATGNGSAGLRQVLEGRDKAAELERDLALTPSNARAPSITAELINRQHQVTACAKGAN